MIPWLLSSRLARAIGGAVAALLVFFGLMAKAKRDGKKEAKHEYQQEQGRRVQAGRDAIRDGRGDSHAERLRRNDAKW